MKTVIILVIIILLVLIYDKYFRPYDSTDNSALNKRSGLSVYVDHATGVQYVKGGLFGGLSVRIKSDGTPYTEVKL